MTPILIPFEPIHVTQFVNRETGIPDFKPARYEGMAFTAVLEGRVLGCAGVNTGLVVGVGIAWASFSEELMRDYPVWITRTVRRVFKDIKMALGLTNVQAIVNPHNFDNQKWIERMGFNKQGTYILYVMEK